MSGAINLRLARKARKRADSEAAAAANRAKFGQSKAATREQRAEAVRRARQLDGAKREAD